jgi:hypothetical protein
MNNIITFFYKPTDTSKKIIWESNELKYKYIITLLFIYIISLLFFAYSREYTGIQWILYILENFILNGSFLWIAYLIWSKQWIAWKFIDLLLVFLLSNLVIMLNMIIAVIFDKIDHNSLTVILMIVSFPTIFWFLWLLWKSFSTLWNVKEWKIVTLVVLSLIWTYVISLWYSQLIESLNLFVL